MAGRRAPTRREQMRDRGEQILDAAASLVRSTKSTAFTMTDVAREAGVSPATLYNRFGTKDALFYALLNHVLDKLPAGVPAYSSESPIEYPIEAARVATDVFVADTVLYRSLFLVMLGVPDEEHRARFLDRSLDYFRRSIEAADRQSPLAPTIEAGDLARELVVHYLGAVGLWAHEDLDGDGFRALVIYGTAFHLLPIADRRSRSVLLRHMEVAKRDLPATFSSGRLASPPAWRPSRSR